MDASNDDVETRLGPMESAQSCLVIEYFDAIGSDPVSDSTGLYIRHPASVAINGYPEKVT